MKGSTSYWVFPANPVNYDALGAFAKLEEVDWGTNNNLSEGAYLQQLYCNITEYSTKPLNMLSDGIWWAATLPTR